MEKHIEKTREKGYRARVSVNGKLMTSKVGTLKEAREHKSKFLKMRNKSKSK